MLRVKAHTSCFLLGDSPGEWALVEHLLLSQVNVLQSIAKFMNIHLLSLLVPEFIAGKYFKNFIYISEGADNMFVDLPYILCKDRYWV